MWDGLARTIGGLRLLVEAKANIPEFNSSPSAASEASLTTIKQALDETRSFLRIRSETDWTRCFYQYTNRLAHLHFLKELNGIDAAIVFVYFTGAITVPGRVPVARGLGGSDRACYPPPWRTHQHPVAAGKLGGCLCRRHRSQRRLMTVVLGPIS